ncbi:MAG: 30S ribosomal protein S17 [Robiginitomaculum sp.]|nr:30S ribosomal protein S17 [Robiginitomaculum sp.]
MPRRILQGVVVSDKGQKTIVVRVDRTYLHPLLQKTLRKSKKYHAHDEDNQFKTGDQVRIRECPPKSKLKRWEVITA